MERDWKQTLFAPVRTYTLHTIAYGHNTQPEANRNQRTGRCFCTADYAQVGLSVVYICTVHA